MPQLPTKLVYGLITVSLSPITLPKVECPKVDVSRPNGIEGVAYDLLFLVGEQNGGAFALQERGKVEGNFRFRAGRVVGGFPEVGSVHLQEIGG